MSATEDPTRDIKPVTSARVDSSASPILDADATLDTSGAASSAPSAADRTTPEPKHIGAYRLVRRLGEGSMGQVWRAEQTAPVRRQVPLKLVKVGMNDGDVLKRFQSERQSRKRLIPCLRPVDLSIVRAGFARESKSGG